MKLSRRAVAAAVRVPGDILPTGIQVESWRLLNEELAADAAAAAERARWTTRRAAATAGLRALVERFVAGEIGLAELRSTLDARTRREWDTLGLRGVSGALFLNQLARRAPDGDALERALRAVLRRPADAGKARAQLDAFVAWLAGAAAGAGGGRRGVTQPARAAFLVSVAWHAHDPERWPGYHLSARQALAIEDSLFVPSGDAVADYFTFRTTFLALARALDVSTPALEFLCWWHQRRAATAGGRAASPAKVVRQAARHAAPSRRRAAGTAAEYPRAPSGGRAAAVRVSEPPAARYAAPRPAPDEGVRPAARGGGDAAPGHTHTQWLLATLGRRLGCRVWVAANDRAREWDGEALGALSLDRMPPLGLDPASERLVRLIDVVWLRGAHQVVAAFEVERTTSVHAGLLRMADLAALAPNLSFPLYAVVPAARLEKVRRELARPTFQALELHRRCAFFSAESLHEAAPEIMRWASAPSALERLAERVGDAPVDAPADAPGDMFVDAADAEDDRA